MDFAGGSWFNTPVSNKRTGNLGFDDISFGGMFEPLCLDHGVSFASNELVSGADGMTVGEPVERTVTDRSKSAACGETWQGKFRRVYLDQR